MMSERKFSTEAKASNAWVPMPHISTRTMRYKGGGTPFC